MWVEGFATPTLSPEIATFGPSYIGSVAAHSFADACDRLLLTGDMAPHYNRHYLSFWGCRLYDNLADASRKFKDPEGL